MMAMHGFSGWRLGLCTRRVLRGGRRMALALPDMLGEIVCLCGGTGLRQWGGECETRDVAVVGCCAG